MPQIILKRYWGVHPFVAGSSKGKADVNLFAKAKTYTFASCKDFSLFMGMRCACASQN